MKSESGFEVLLKKLDRVFLLDPNWKCFNTYLAFGNYRRPKECSINLYLSEFDTRHYKLKECNVTLPDAVVACRLHKSCNLSDMHFQLALSTTAEMTFENMRNTLKRLFAESGHLLIADSDTNVKVEQWAVAAEVTYSSNSGRSKWRGGSTRRDKPPLPPRFSAARDQRSNPLRPDCSISLCAVCGSKVHWARRYPRASDRPSTASAYFSDMNSVDCEEEVRITTITSETNYDSKMNTLLGETLGSVLLDSGCSKTVCGRPWLQCFLDTLSATEKVQVVYESSSSMFRFGDGERRTAAKCAIVPCMLAGKNVSIRADVVDSNIPLLLSRTSMKKAGMVINMTNIR